MFLNFPVCSTKSQIHFCSHKSPSLWYTVIATQNELRWVAITKHHRLFSLNTRNVFSHRRQDWRCHQLGVLFWLSPRLPSPCVSVMSFFHVQTAYSVFSFLFVDACFVSWLSVTVKKHLGRIRLEEGRLILAHSSRGTETWAVGSAVSGPVGKGKNHVNKAIKQFYLWEPGIGGRIRRSIFIPLIISIRLTS